MSKDSPRKTFVLSDESLNSYGFRVLTAGISLERFKKNPVMLWNHGRSYRDDRNTILPIGRWENLRVEDGKLLADAFFDMDDPFAASIANKVSKGIISSCSICIEKVELSDAPEDIVAGQKRMTVKRSVLFEASITDIPSNENSVFLYENGRKFELNAESVDCAIGLINNSNNKKELNMKLIALKLGLSENATEAEIMAKVQGLLDLSATVSEKDREIAQLKASAATAAKKVIEDLVNGAVLAKKLTADQKDHFVKIGETMGVDALKTTLASMNTVVKPTDIVSVAPGSALATDKKWADLSAKEREVLRDADKDVYIALFEKEYGFKPEIE